MSRNGGSDILVAASVATISSLSIGLAAVLNDPSFQRTIAKEIILPPIEYVYQTVIKPVWDGVTAPIQQVGEDLKKSREKKTAIAQIRGNEPISLFYMPECKEPKDYNLREVSISQYEVSQHISQNCKDIYYASAVAIINERFKTNKPLSQERLEQKSRKAANKKWQELRHAGSVTTGTVTISTIVLIADIAVAESGGHDERRAN